MGNASWQVRKGERGCRERGGFGDGGHDVSHILHPGQRQAVALVEPFPPIGLAVDAIGMGEIGLAIAPGWLQRVEPGGGFAQPFVDWRSLTMWDLIDPCLLYTSDAADDLLCVDLGGRR